MNFLKNNLAKLLGMAKSKSAIAMDNPEQYKLLMEATASCGEPALPGQVAQSIGCVFSALKFGFTNLIGEPGVGKTNIAAYIILLLSNLIKNNNNTVFDDEKVKASIKRYKKYLTKRGFKACFLSDGSKHYNKMAKTFERVIGARTFIIRNFKDAEKMLIEPPVGEIWVFIVSKDSARLTFANKELKKCPRCLYNPYEKKDKRSKQVFLKCPKCGESLLTSQTKNLKMHDFSLRTKENNAKGIRRVPIFWKLKKLAKRKKVFDLAIVDEVHNMAGFGTLQSQAYRELASLSSMTVNLTGTLANGYASSMHNLLCTMNPTDMKKRGYFGAKGVNSFIQNFGGMKNSIKTAQSTRGRRGAKGSRKLQLSKASEIPLISPALYAHMFAGNTAYLNMEELNYTMPAYSEEVIPVSKEPWRQSLYDLLTFDEDVKNFFKMIDKSSYHAKASFLKLMLYAEDNMTIPYQLSVSIDEETCQKAMLLLGQKKVFEDATGYRLKIGELKEQMDKELLSNKELALISKLRQEFAQGRRCMVYTYFTHKTKINERLVEVLNKAFPDKQIGILPEKLKAEKIEAFLEDNYFDVCIAPYKRVATGMDIVMYPTLIFYQFGYEITGIRQARRRAWRAVKQKNECRVFFMAYEGPQSTTLSLLTKKIAAASVAEGEIVKRNDIAALSMSSLEVELLNRIVDNAEEIMSQEYKTEHIPKGKLRPWTKWEMYYLNLLKDINPLVIEYIDPEMFSKLNVKKEEEAKPLVSVFDAEDKPSVEDETELLEESNDSEVEFNFSFGKTKDDFTLKTKKREKVDESDFILIIKRKGKRKEIFSSELLDTDEVLYRQATLF